MSLRGGAREGPVSACPPPRGWGRGKPTNGGGGGGGGPWRFQPRGPSTEIGSLGHVCGARPRQGEALGPHLAAAPDLGG